MMPDLFKEILPSILQNKKNVLETEEDEKSYVPFVVNKAVSFHLDCIMPANVMNMNHTLDKKLQYHYYLNTLRGYKRPFHKWYKRETLENLDLVKEYFNYSNEKAKEALKVLSEDQLSEIRKLNDKGGTDEKPRRISLGKVEKSR